MRVKWQNGARVFADDLGTAFWLEVPMPEVWKRELHRHMR
jgi:hypothetical protein